MVSCAVPALCRVLRLCGIRVDRHVHGEQDLSGDFVCYLWLVGDDVGVRLSRAMSSTS